MFCEEKRIKQGLFLYIILFIKESLQQKIHYNGNIFWNKCYRCNEGSLYKDGKKGPLTAWRLLPQHFFRKDGAWLPMSVVVVGPILVLLITKTCLYHFDPLKLHFYIVKLGFTGYTLFFYFCLKNIECEYSLEPPRRGGAVLTGTHNLCFEQKYEKY